VQVVALGAGWKKRERAAVAAVVTVKEREEGKG
jgi:hypothetical protein